MMTATPKRKIPLGLRAPFYIGGEFAAPGLLVGIMMLCAPFLNPYLRPDNPFFWTSAAKATIIDTEQYHDKQGNKKESILFTYLDPQKGEQRKICETEKLDFFVAGKLYSLRKFQNDWDTVTLSDLPFDERYPDFKESVSDFIELGVCCIGFCSIILWVSHKRKRQPLKLMRFGNHAFGTYSHDEKRSTIERIFALKKKTYQYTTDKGSRHSISVIRKRKNDDQSNVDVFYDPQNPESAIVLQSYEPKRISYSSQENSFKTARRLTVYCWCYWTYNVALWIASFYLVVKLYLSQLS